MAREIRDLVVAGDPMGAAVLALCAEDRDRDVVDVAAHRSIRALAEQDSERHQPLIKRFLERMLDPDNTTEISELDELLQTSYDLGHVTFEWMLSLEPTYWAGFHNKETGERRTQFFWGDEPPRFSASPPPSWRQ